jgi:ketol-acid reductoisomerase
MQRILGEIQDGTFAKEWIGEAGKGFPRFRELRAAARSSKLEEVGKRLRGMMPWLESDRKVAPDA